MSASEPEAREGLDKVIEDIGFRWDKAPIDEGARFTALLGSGRVQLLAVSDQYASCDNCVSELKRDEFNRRLCHELPSCDTLVFIEDTAENRAEYIAARLTGGWMYTTTDDDKE